eukprot:3993798-Amphidinium_carterae.1
MSELAVELHAARWAFGACNNEVCDPRIEVLLREGEVREGCGLLFEGGKVADPDAPGRVGNMTGGSCGGLDELMVGDNKFLNCSEGRGSDVVVNRTKTNGSDDIKIWDVL